MSCLQALVEHFDRKGQPGRVEACVVHLPIMSLDLNQVREIALGSLEILNSGQTGLASSQYISSLHPRMEIAVSLSGLCSPRQRPR